jgi:hypothetical protein
MRVQELRNDLYYIYIYIYIYSSATFIEVSN